MSMKKGEAESFILRNENNIKFEWNSACGPFLSFQIALCCSLRLRFNAVSFSMLPEDIFRETLFPASFEMQQESCYVLARW